MIHPPSAERYRMARRRLLIDMHIPDWDAGFLAGYDPRDAFAAAREAGAEALMVYFQNHLGQCYYPTECGVRHAKAKHRDLAGELVELAREGGIATAAYYSVNFNNQAWLDHPDWRLVPAAPAVIGPLPRQRYGIVCLNHPDQRAFVLAQLREILGYPVDALCCDMMWWNGICICESCQERYRLETGEAIPEVVNWADPAWVRFQHARQRWLTEWSGELAALCARLRPEIDCYHNFALGLSNWTRATSFELSQTAAFLGGDFYRTPQEQLLVTRYVQSASRNQPAEFMTTATLGLTDHTALRSPAEMRRKALAAAHADQAFLAILAVDPDGRIDPDAIELCRHAFAAMPPEAMEPGRTPYAEVAVYFSDTSRIDLSAAPVPLAQAPSASVPDYPHYRAVAGAVAKLQRRHIPFAVISKRQIACLEEWPAIMLCNAQGMDHGELDAFKDYVERGGKLYCSAASGKLANGSWPLGEWLGLTAKPGPCGEVYYLETPDRRPLTHRRSTGGPWGIQRFAAEPNCKILAQLTLPFGYPYEGSIEAANFASIHSSPPWQQTDEPAIVRIAIGKGEVVYCGADVEAGSMQDHELWLMELVDRLRPADRLQLEAHPDVWMSIYRSGTALRLMLLHYSSSDLALPVDPPRLRFGALGSGKSFKIVACDGSPSGEATLIRSVDTIELPSFRESLIVDVDLSDRAYA
ncbi:MAG: hypothetical protein ACOY7T_16030 [Pseudomonadota bacterium]